MVNLKAPLHLLYIFQNIYIAKFFSHWQNLILVHCLRRSISLLENLLCTLGCPMVLTAHEQFNYVQLACILRHTLAGYNLSAMTLLYLLLSQNSTMGTYCEMFVTQNKVPALNRTINKSGQGFTVLIQLNYDHWHCKIIVTLLYTYYITDSIHNSTPNFKCQTYQHNFVVLSSRFKI